MTEQQELNIAIDTLALGAKTMTHQFKVEFTFTCVNQAEDVAELVKHIHEVITEPADSGRFTAEQRVFCMMALQAAEKEGLEGLVREALRFNIRKGMPEALKGEIPSNWKHSPFKVIARRWQSV